MERKEKEGRREVLKKERGQLTIQQWVDVELEEEED
jgi:hypothetical protein